MTDVGDLVHHKWTSLNNNCSSHLLKFHDPIKVIQQVMEVLYRALTFLGYNLTLVRTNLTRVTSPPNSTPRRFSSYFLLTPLIFSFHLLPLPVHPTDFPSVSSPASLPFISSCHQRTTTTCIGFPSKLLLDLIFCNQPSKRHVHHGVQIQLRTPLNPSLMGPYQSLKTLGIIIS